MAAIPSHVRHLQFGGHFEFHHFAGQDAQAFVRAVFVADVEQQLQPQADAKERLVGGHGVFDGAHQIAAAQFGDGVFETRRRRGG